LIVIASANPRVERSLCQPKLMAAILREKFFFLLVSILL